MIRRLAAAATISLIGTLVLAILASLLFGLINGAGVFAGCAVGAFLTTLAAYRPNRTLSLRGVVGCLIIVFGTFGFISCGYLFWKVLQGTSDFTTPAEAKNMFLWACFATSWFLVPGTALTLVLFDRLFSAAERRRAINA